jgi:hypothetical protein
MVPDVWGGSPPASRQNPRILFSQSNSYTNQSKARLSLLGTTEENCNTIQLRALFGQLESLRESLQTLRAGGYGLL